MLTSREKGTTLQCRVGTARAEPEPVATAFRQWLSGAHADVLRDVQLVGGMESTFPGGSRGRVNRAGDRVRHATATPDDIAVINTWREAHRHVINSFQSILRKRTRGLDVVVAQRHKRQNTIFDKLTRLPKMQLSRMDDVAGCRLIFKSIAELRHFRDTLHKRSRFNHKLKNGLDKYDYIAHPKDSGYRGIHDVYEYDVKSISGRGRKGLLIELQYRTFNQHAWATTVELVGILTSDQPKFDRGSAEIKLMLRLASEIVARAFEDTRSSLPDLSNRDVVEQFTTLDGKLNLMKMLRNLNSSHQSLTEKKDMILIFGDTDREELMEVRSYPSMTVALRALFNLEKERPETDIVLVRSERPEDVREAFRNYFSDARQFIDLVDSGRGKLLRRRVAFDRPLAN